MLRKINFLLSIILILFCITSFVDADNIKKLDTDIKEAYNTLNDRLNEMFENLAWTLHKWFIQIDTHFVNTAGALVVIAILFIIGILLVCVIAPCVYIFTSCIEMCTHWTDGRKETRRLKRTEKFKYFYERIAALELKNGITAEIEIIDDDKTVENKDEEKEKKKDEGKKKKKGKGKKEKKNESKVEQSVGVSVDGQEKTKSVQKSL